MARPAPDAAIAQAIIRERRIDPELAGDAGIGDDGVDAKAEQGGLTKRAEG